MKHTPGPWRIDSRDGLEIVGKPSWPCNRYGKKGEWTVAIVEDLDDRKETRANARLIAAAPELLEALTWALDHFDGSTRCNAEQEQSCIEKCRAAITKATGAA